MCGIVACKLKRKLTPSDIHQMDAMRDALEHRGPDGYGSYVSEEDGLYLGHRRLSIIGLNEQGRQPMRQDNLIISYNGEVYNYIEIAKELDDKQGCYNDTQTILKAWQQWEEKALDKFDGMFAFALWDDNKKSLTLATDIFGEKPLYQYQNEDGYYFCSEVGPLIEMFSLNFEPSDHDISDFLYLGYIRPPHTGFKNLTNIGPSNLIKITGGAELTISKYWTLPEMNIGSGRIHPISPEQCNDIKDILCRSLDIRLRADVPVGLFLSGGVDSSLIAALASKELNQNIQAYTVSFPDGQDESAVASGIAKHLSLEHTVINSRNSDLWRNAIEELNAIYGVPNDNMTALAVYQMCLSAKEHLTVALSGLGGDEIFYGYNKYAFFYKNRGLYNNSQFFSAIGKYSKWLPLIGKKFGLMHELMQGNQDEQYLRLKSGNMFCNLMALHETKPQSIIENRDIGIVHNVRVFDILSSMPQSYIPAIDRGSMRASVEVRTPFLCRELIEYVAGIDQRALISHGKKNVLKSILKNYMSLDILNQSKQGFVFPAHRYFSEMNPAKPELPFLNKNTIADVWGYRNDVCKQSLMTRLSVLGAMDYC